MLAKLKDGAVFFKRFLRTGPEGSVVRLESLNPNYTSKDYPAGELVYVYPAVEVVSRLRR